MMPRSSFGLCVAFCEPTMLTCQSALLMRATFACSDIQRYESGND